MSHRFVRLISLISAVALGTLLATAAWHPVAQPSGAVAAATSRPEPTLSPPGPSPTQAPPTPTPLPLPFPALPPTPPPDPTPAPSPTPTVLQPYAVNLYRKGDFVSQATKEQCVSAAMQIMLNIVRDEPDRTARTQSTLATLARQLSEAANGGTEPEGWARGLTKLGAGRYVVAVEPTRGKAILRAIRALRDTGRPVGLLVWRGAHSWVLHGFESSADPALTDRFALRALYLSDPWYPRVSSIWGPSRGPNARVRPALLAEDYLPWRRPTGRYPGKDGQFVLILPVP